MIINEYFDHVYLLNLHKRPQRLSLSRKRMNFCEIEFDLFHGTDGSVMKKLWEVHRKENSFFSAPSYVGCAISHLSIYRDAVENGYKRVLIVEDDNRILRNANLHFSTLHWKIPSWELLYLGFIPLSDDCTRWDYNVFEVLCPGIGVAKNFWGLFGYGITQELMTEMLDVYEKDFPMEIDRYFVNKIQPRGRSYGILPQIFAADDGESDNSGRIEMGMLQRSVDSRFGNLIDYV